MRPLHAFRCCRSVIAVLLVLSGLTIGSAPIHAQSGSATSSVTPSDATPNIGQQIEVAINIDVSGVNPPDDAVGSFTGSLDWNPAVLAYSGNSGIVAGFTGVVNDADVSSGHIVFNGAKPAGAKGNITVLSITFDVTGAGTSSLDLAYSAMASAMTFKDLMPLLTVNDSQVQVPGIPTEYTLTVSVDPAGGGTTQPAAGAHTYAAGAVVEVTAAAATGYAFDEWSGACTGSGACQVAMDEDKAVTAHFDQVTYYELTIAVDPAEGGTTDPAAGTHTYPEGAVVDITALPAASYEFDRWSGACKGSGPCQVTMEADKAVTARFAELPLPCYALTLSHRGLGSDPVADPASSTDCPSGRYNEGEIINLSGAVPDPGWRISAWQGTSQDDSTADTNSLTMPASAHAAGVIYTTQIYIPVICAGVTTSGPVPSQAVVRESQADTASAPTTDTEAVESAPVEIPARQVAEGQQTTAPAVIEEGGTTTSHQPEPISGESPSSPPQVATQQTAGEQDSAAAAAFAEGDDVTSAVPDSPMHHLLGTTEQRTWMPPLLFSLAVLAVLVGLLTLAILVVSTVHLIKQRHAGSE